MPTCGPGLPAHSSSPSHPPSLLLAFLALFLPFCCLSSSLLSRFPLFLFGSLVLMAVFFHLPIPPASEAGQGCEGGPVPCPSAHPMPARCGGLFVCCRGFVSLCVCTRVSGSLGLHPADWEPPGSGPCLWPPQSLCTTPCTSSLGAGEAPWRE